MSASLLQRTWVRTLAMIISLLLLLLSLPVQGLQALMDSPVHVEYTWTTRSTNTDQWLRGLAHGNGAIVAVGDGGTIRTSPDGMTWTARNSGSTRNLMAVAFGSSGFVAVGESGTILTSPDGQSWTQRPGGTTEHLHAVTFGNGRYVAVGENGKLLTSPDGAVWTHRITATDAKLYGVGYGNRLFVAVGYGGTILTSPDGTVWTARSSGTTRYLSDVAFGNGSFVILGDADTVLTSADGGTWTLQPPDPGERYGLWALAFGEGQFVAVGGVGNILSSPDGVSWHRHKSSDFNFLDGIAYVNGQFVTVGSMGSIRTSGTTPLRPDTGAPGTALPEPSLPPPLLPAEPEPVKPPQEPVVAPPPAPAPKPALTCEQGQVTGPRQERRIGGLTILADGVLDRSGGTEEFCGNISINRHLQVDGRLVYDPGNGQHAIRLAGEGHVYVQTSAPFLFGTMSLFTGQFELTGDLTELLKKQGIDQLRIAGVTYKIERLQLVNEGVRAKGQIVLPPPWHEHPIKIENVEIIRGELNLKGEFSLPDVRIGTVKLSHLSASFDTKANTFVGRGRITIEEMLGIEAAFGMKDGRLDTIGFGLSGTNIPVDSTGLFLTRIYGEVEGVTSWPPRQIVASVDISGGPAIAGRTAIKGRDVTFVVDLSGKVSGSGELVLLDNFKVAEAEFLVDLQRGFRIKGGINIEDAIIGMVEISVMDREFYGRGHGVLAIPKSVRFVGGQQLAEQELTIDKRAIAAALDVGKFTLTCRKPWDDRFDCSSNLKQLFGFAHEVRYLASTEMLATAIPEASFTMPPGVEQALIRLAWDQGDADFVLTAPDGTKITPATAGQGGYVKRPEQLEAYYALENPQAGTWTYSVTASGARQYGVEVFHVLAPPKLTLGAPLRTAGAGPVTITWNAQAPAGSKVNLYYDETGTGYRGILIASELDAATGRYTWAPDILPSGSYYIYASVDDGANAPVFAYAPGTVRIENPATPMAPADLTGRSVGGKAELSWTPPAGRSVAGYRVYLKETGESVAVGSQTSFGWAGLQPGRSYTFTVAAFGDDGLEGPQSAPANVTVIPAAPPGLAVDWPQFALTNRAELTVSGQIEAGATGVLYLNDAQVKSGLTGSFRETVKLQPGPNQVRIAAAKPAGDTAEQSQAYFLDTTPPQLSIFTLSDGMSVSGSSLNVTGQVEPGARLTLNGRAVTVSADGSFAAMLQLTPGANKVELVARDEAGNETAFRGTVNATGTGTAACGQRFPDVAASHPACKAIEQLAALQVINGYADGTFQPNQGVTRAEFAKMLVLTLGETPEPNKTLPFTDTVGHWAAAQGYLQRVHTMGAINGVDPVTFKPDASITRAEAVKIAAAAAGLTPEGTPIYPDVRAQDWFAGWVAVAHRNSLVGVRAPTPLWYDTFFRADTSVTRAEAAILLANLSARK